MKIGLNRDDEGSRDEDEYVENYFAVAKRQVISDDEQVDEETETQHGHDNLLGDIWREPTIQVNETY
jgi:hypothetical protein